MGTVQVVFNQCLLMLLYLYVGAALFKAKLITPEGSKALANLLLYVVLPCVVVNSFCVEWSAEKALALPVSILAAAAVLALAMAVAHLFCRKNPIDDFGAAFSNAGFMGFPLVSAVAGDESVFYAAGFVALLNALQWTYGQYLLTGDKQRLSPRVIWKNPLVLALVAGLIIFYFFLPLPGLVKSAMSSIAALNAPLAMIVLGVYLAQTRLRELFTNPHLYGVSALRLIGIPVASLLVLQLLPGQEEMRQALFIVSAAPVGSNVAVYAHKLGGDYSYAVQLVCLSTLLSIVTMPILMLL